MSKFKVGDRVRITGESGGNCTCPIGHEAVIVGPCTETRNFRWYVECPSLPPGGFPWDKPCGWWSFAPEHLAPILPPASDTWADEKVRDLFKPQYIEPEKIDALRETLRRYV